jgi:hypothetical protein
MFFSLSSYLPDVLLDARRGTDRLLVLQTGQCGTGRPVGEIQADTARREQRDTDQRNDQQQVFAEQPAAQDAGPGDRRQVGRWYGCHCLHSAPRGGVAIPGMQQR